MTTKTVNLTKKGQTSLISKGTSNTAFLFYILNKLLLFYNLHVNKG